MSSLKVNSVVDAAGGNTASINGYTPTMSNMAGRNRIINGDMRIDQRNNGNAVTIGSGSTAGNYFSYSVDRWWCQSYSTSSGNGAAFSVQRNGGSVTPPAGFSNYLGITVTSAQSTMQTDALHRIAQQIEGFTISDFAWGTLSAVPATLSFWVRSSATGVFCGNLNNDNEGGTVHRYIFTFTVNVANTWEFKTVSIPAATAGSWRSNQNLGVSLQFCFGASSNRQGTPNVWGTGDQQFAPGATNLMATNGATFYITGVQLEAGSVATPFERRPYGTELALCQRYCQVLRGATFTKFGGGVVGASNTAWAITCTTKVPMRATPTISQSNCSVTDASGNYAVTGLNNISSADIISFDAVIGTASLTVGRAVMFGDGGGSNAVLTASAEL